MAEATGLPLCLRRQQVPLWHASACDPLAANLCPIWRPALPPCLLPSRRGACYQTYLRPSYHRKQPFSVRASELEFSSKEKKKTQVEQFLAEYGVQDGEAYVSLWTEEQTAQDSASGQGSTESKQKLSTPYTAVQRTFQATQCSLNIKAVAKTEEVAKALVSAAVSYAQEFGKGRDKETAERLLMYQLTSPLPHRPAARVCHLLAAGISTLMRAVTDFAKESREEFNAMAEAKGEEKQKYANRMVEEGSRINLSYVHEAHVTITDLNFADVEGQQNQSYWLDGNRVNGQVDLHGKPEFLHSLVSALAGYLIFPVLRDDDDDEGKKGPLSFSWSWLRGKDDDSDWMPSPEWPVRFRLAPERASRPAAFGLEALAATEPPLSGTDAERTRAKAKQLEVLYKRRQVLQDLREARAWAPLPKFELPPAATKAVPEVKDGWETEYGPLLTDEDWPVHLMGIRRDLLLEKEEGRVARVAGETSGRGQEEEGEYLELLLSHGQLVDLADAVSGFLKDSHTWTESDKPTLPSPPMSLLRPRKRRRWWASPLLLLGGGALLTLAAAAAQLGVLPGRGRGGSAMQRGPAEAGVMQAAAPQRSLRERLISREDKGMGVQPCNQQVADEEMELLCQAVTAMAVSDKPPPQQTGDSFLHDYEMRYQVALTREGEVMGCRPLNTWAAQHWANLPLTRALHGHPKGGLKQGLLERSLKYRPPNEVVVIELIIDETGIPSARPWPEI